MYIIIDEIIYYSRHYSDEFVGDYWWFNKDDYKIYSIKKLNVIFKNKFLDDYRNQLLTHYIPVFKTEMTDLERNYINSKNDIKLSKKFDSIALVDYDRYFKRYIEQNQLHNDWWDYERKSLTKDAIRWCKINHIKCRLLNEK